MSFKPDQIRATNFVKIGHILMYLNYCFTQKLLIFSEDFKEMLRTWSRPLPQILIAVFVLIFEFHQFVIKEINFEDKLIIIILSNCKMVKVLSSLY